MATLTATKPKKTTPVVRLLLDIDDQTYRVRCGTAGPVRAFHLEKTTADRNGEYKFYWVHTGQAEGAKCDCADFTFRRDGIDPEGCKHIQALRVVGLA